MNSDSQQENRQGGKLVAALKQSEGTSRMAATADIETDSRSKALAAFDKSGSGSNATSPGVNKGISQTGVGISNLNDKPKSMSINSDTRSNREVISPPPPSPAQPQQTKDNTGVLDAIMMIIVKVAMGIFSNGGAMLQQSSSGGK